jgi:hypothetical protein
MDACMRFSGWGTRANVLECRTRREVRDPAPSRAWSTHPLPREKGCSVLEKDRKARRRSAPIRRTALRGFLNPKSYSKFPIDRIPKSLFTDAPVSPIDRPGREKSSHAELETCSLQAVTRLSSQTRSLRTFTKKGRWLHFHRARVPFPTPDGASQRPPARGGGPRGVPQRGVDAVPRRARVVQKTHGRGVRGESASAPLFPSLAIPNDFSFPAHPEAGRVRAATARYRFLRETRVGQ